MLSWMVWAIILPFLGGVLIYFFKSKRANYGLFFFQGLETIIVGSLIRGLLRNGAFSYVVGGWNRDLGIELGVDRITVLFMVLTVILWWMAMLYMWPSRGADVKHVFFLLICEGMFMGFIQTRDLFNMFLFVEVITMISTILIMYHKDANSVRAGLYYLLFNNLGMLFFLVGVALVYLHLGTLNTTHLRELLPGAGEHPSMHLAFVFFAAAMGVKAAFFPVYNWLPTAHAAAPSHVSALLSGILVKTGIYGFIRISDMFGYSYFNAYFVWVGIISAVGGVVFAMVQKDIKMILGYHTISQVGLLFTSLSFGTELAQEAALIHLLNHGVFKSLLFMGAGVTVNLYGTRSVDKIRGLFQKAPIVSFALITGSLAITGFPLLSGYAGKHLFAMVFKKTPMFYALFQVVNLGTMVSFLKLSAIHFGEAKVPKTAVVSKFQRAPLLFLSLLAMTSFPYLMASQPHAWTLSILYGPITTLLKDSVAYGLLGAVGYSVYRTLIKPDPPFVKRLRSYNLGFETSNFMLIFFIFTMMVYWIAQT